MFCYIWEVTGIVSLTIWSLGKFEQWLYFSCTLICFYCTFVQTEKCVHIFIFAQFSSSVVGTEPCFILCSFFKLIYFVLYNCRSVFFLNLIYKPPLISKLLCLLLEGKKWWWDSVDPSVNSYLSVTEGTFSSVKNSLVLNIHLLCRKLESILWMLLIYVYFLFQWLRPMSVLET